MVRDPKVVSKGALCVSMALRLSRLIDGSPKPERSCILEFCVEATPAVDAATPEYLRYGLRVGMKI